MIYNTAPAIIDSPMFTHDDYDCCIYLGRHGDDGEYDLWYAPHTTEIILRFGDNGDQYKCFDTRTIDACGLGLPEYYSSALTKARAYHKHITP